jgi:hypothetical protein
MKNAPPVSTVIYNIFFVISIVAFLFCYIKIGVAGKPVYLLPLSYAAALRVCSNLKKSFLSLSVILINSVCLVRYALYPMTLVVGTELYCSSEAIYLMIYEVIVVVVFLSLYSGRVRNLNIKESCNYKSNELGALNIVLICITVILGLLFPSLFSVFIFYGTEAESLSGIITMTFALGTMVIYSSIITKLRNLKGGGSFALLLSVLFALFYIYITSFGETNVHRWKFLFVGIPTVYLLLESFPKYRKGIISFAFIAMPISVVLGSFVKFGIVDVSFNSFSSFFLTNESLNAYFGGVDGVTNALSILRGNTNALSVKSTLTDFFGNMPVVSRFFNTDVFSTEAMYLDALGRTDQICPLLAQSVIHFGILGAPVLSIIMTIIAVESERFAKKSKTVYSLYGAIMLCVIFSLFMCLNTTIMMPNLWKLLLFLIIQYLNEKFFLNGKVVNYRSSI